MSTPPSPELSSGTKPSQNHPKKAGMWERRRLPRGVGSRDGGAGGRGRGSPAAISCYFGVPLFPCAPRSESPSLVRAAVAARAGAAGRLSRRVLPLEAFPADGTRVVLQKATKMRQTALGGVRGAGGDVGLLPAPTRARCSCCGRGGCRAAAAPARPARNPPCTPGTPDPPLRRHGGERFTARTRGAGCRARPARVPRVPRVLCVPCVLRVPRVPQVLCVPRVPWVPRVPCVLRVPHVPRVLCVLSARCVPRVPHVPRVQRVLCVPHVPRVPCVPHVPRVLGVPGTRSQNKVN